MHPYSRTTHGFWIFSPPVTIVDEGDEGVGRELLRILSESREDVPHPDSWKGLTDPLTRAAGVRSFNALIKGAKSVDICLDDNGVVFIPTLNGGLGRAFLHLKDKAMRTTSRDDTAVATALRAAFAACEEEF